MDRKFTTRRAGFTLIEVLVVVAIIALLVSILLPSLAKAKEQARSAVCASHISQVCKGAGMYTTEQKEWIPGCPMTTGYFWVKNYPSNAWDPSLPGFNRLAVEWFDYATPLRAQMYGPKSVPLLPDATDTRRALFKKITEEPFLCPSNQERYGPFPIGGNFPTIRATSYLTMSTIVRGGPGTWSEFSKINSGLANDAAQSSSWEIAPPSGYVPKLGRLGRTQMKVFIADGLRFYDPDSGMDYNTDPSGTKGIMTADPPSTGWPYGREYNVARTLSYRHGQKDRMNAGFFDGHVETMGVTAGPSPQVFTGKAVDPKYYYPSGSIVNTPTALHKSNILPGTKLQ